MIRLSAAIAVVLLGTTAVATARPHHHHHHHHHRHRHHIVVHRHPKLTHANAAHRHQDSEVAHQVAEPDGPARKRRPIRSASSAGSSRPPLRAAGGFVDLARTMLGETAGQLGLPPSLWCADFVNLVLRKEGRAGTGSRVAASFAHYGRPISGPQVGAIAVMSRRGGGHVGIVSGIDASGNPIIISGNSRGRVRETTYRPGRIYAYRMP